MERPSPVLMPPLRHKADGLGHPVGNENRVQLRSITSPDDNLRNMRRSRRYSCARTRASVTAAVAPFAFSYSRSPSSTQIVVWNEERTEPLSASQFQPPSL